MFLDKRFPDCISYGSEFGPGFATDVVSAKSGKEYRNQNWEESRYGGNVVYGIRTEEDFLEMIAMFRIAKGRAHAFRFKDHGDYQATDSYFATGDGSTRALQLQKRYSYGTDTDDRKITRPVAPITIKRDGNAFTSFTLDDTTGIVTLTPDTTYADISDLSAAASDSSFNSTGSDLSQFAVGDFVQVSGFYAEANNGYFKVATSAADKITVTDEDDNAVTLVDEDATSTRTITRAAYNDTGTDFSFTASGSVIARSSGDFGNLVVGETITISGSTSNDGTYTVASVSDSPAEITVEEALTDEAEGDSVTINRAEVQVSNTDIEVSSAGAFTSSGEDLSVFKAGAEITTTGFFQSENNDTFTVDTSSANTLAVDETTTLEEVANPDRTIEEEPSQPGAVFTWTGEFDVPCRFDIDRLPRRYEDFKLQAADIPIVEVRE